LAAKTGNVELFTLLLEHGADPSIQDFSDSTALDYAKEVECEEIIDILRQAQDEREENEIEKDAVEQILEEEDAEA